MLLDQAAAQVIHVLQVGIREQQDKVLEAAKQVDPHLMHVQVVVVLDTKVAQVKADMQAKVVLDVQ